MHPDDGGAAADTILVIEDEILVRMVIADYLRDCGYRVFEGGTVDEAIAILRAEARIDLVFSDIQMPGDHDGTDLVRWVYANVPHVDVILTSGGRTAVDLAQDLCHAGPLMGKPYHLPDVLGRIQALLDRKDRRPPDQRSISYN